MKRHRMIHYKTYNGSLLGTEDIKKGIVAKTRGTIPSRFDAASF